MNSCVVKLCIFLLLTEGTLGAEITINVRKSASLMFVCYNYEVLRKCYCPSFPEDCQHCTHWTEPVSFSTTFSDKFETYFNLSGLKHSNSGLYTCSDNQRIGQKYRVNVLEEQYSTVVIATVGQSVVLSSSTQQDMMAALEKQWCRLDNADVCQPNTVMGPENGPSGDFQILATDSSFFLEKRNVTHGDAGSYRLTLIFPNQTKVYVVNLQVKEKSNNLQIIPVRDKDKTGERFEIICQYSQELESFSKYWLCDNLECPDNVTSVDDRFKSALVLTLDHAPCSKIEEFRCVAKTSGSIVKSNVYLKRYSPTPVKIDIANLRHNRVKVNIYTLLQLSCFRPNRYIFEYRDIHSSRHYDYLFSASWCKVSGNQCTSVIEKTQKQIDAVILEMCVTPNNNETTYRCKFNTGTLDVTVSVVGMYNIYLLFCLYFSLQRNI
ncbi:uncharacterized protein LOC117943179 [Etheostoma cragini]|uniref:uncharacterized protein LOC117943179 n=1 Tax=Etheostoma cragini TaxID=417921 RepID=UPI00155EAEB0|nr:uncharacterized protein LOC117943179 [Etheostoma cragini]